MNCAHISETLPPTAPLPVNDMIETLEVENRMLRARNERLEETLTEATHRIAALQIDLDAQDGVFREERDIAIKAYRELLLKYDRLEELVQK